MVFRRLAARLKRPPQPTDPTNASGATNTANDGIGRPPPTNPQDTGATDPDQQATGERDLWLEALRKLPLKSQVELEKRGLKSSEPHQIEAFQKEAERIRDQSLARDWKIQIGDHELRIRETTIHIVHWARKIGDAAIQFSPSPGAGVWAVVKSILQEIDTFDKEKTALLSVVDKVAGAIFCGQVYYEIYTPERTDKEVVDKLHEALVDLYACVLELLAISTDLASNTAAQFCRAVFDTEKPSEMLSELQSRERDLATVADKCEITAHARQEAVLKKYLEEAEDSLQKIRHNVDQVLQRVSDQERRSLLEWISTIQYGRHHDEIEEKRRADTGNWLIENEEFREWMDSPSSSVLWLQGSPGTGKTFLTSAVVKHIETTVGSQMEGFAYFFCNRDEQNRYEALPLLRSLVRQLAAPKNNTQSVRKSLKEARDKATDRASQLGLSDCHHQLLESFNLYTTSIIVIDALDEVLDHELDLLMERLDELSSKTEAGNKVKLFVASRPEKEIARMYGSGPTVIIQASDNKADIERYVRMEMDTFGKRFPKSDVNAMKNEIITTILDKCDNMFLWAALQVKQITKCNSIDSIEYSLQTLPRGLNATYDQICSKIQDLPLPDKELAQRTIRWVMCAPSPLDSQELLGAVQISIEKDHIKLVNRVKPDSLLSICENLLIIDSQGHWRFFHLSVREYFETVQNLTQPAFSFCAKVCFQSLIKTFSPKGTATISTGDPQNSGHVRGPLNPKHPFSKHIQTSWPFYAVQQTERDESISYLKQFLGSLEESSQYFVLWVSHVFHEPLATFESLESFYLRIDDLTPTTTPIFVIAYFSLYEVLYEWCHKQAFDPNQRNNRGDSLLTIAAMANCVPLLADLISRGASVNLNSVSKRYGSCLAAAAYWGHLDTVKYLVEEAQADVNLLLKLGYGSALAAAAAAARGRDTDIVKYLVEEAQADVNLLLECGEYGSALATAAYWGRLDTVKYLVEEAQADVNLLLEIGYGSALATAAFGGELDIVKYLVEEAHADVNLLLEASKYGSALAIAAFAGELDIVKYLVEEAHADVNLLLESGEYGSALAAAARGKALDIVKYLVEEAHADVNLLLRTGNYSSALAAAAYGEELDIVKYLVEDAQADVNLLLENGGYGSVLAVVAYGGLEIFKYLVEETQADVNLLLENGEYGSALAAAAYWGNLDIVKYLVEDAQADVNLLLETGYGSALAAATWWGQLDIIKYLVEEAYADVNLLLETGYGSALATAARRGKLDTVKYLVKEAQADVNLLLKTGEYGSALATSTWWGQLDIIKYLVEEAYADVNLLLETGYGSALAAAVDVENVEIVQYLVEKGKADFNLQFRVGQYSSALDVALTKEDHSIAQYLISRGAAAG